MKKSLPVLWLLFSLSVSLPALAGVPIRPVKHIAVAAADEEYDRYKKRADDFFKEGHYAEARGQYLNCLEVPGYENDVYAKTQIEKCNTALAIRQQAEDSLAHQKEADALTLFAKVLDINPADAQTRGRLVEYHQTKGTEYDRQQQFEAAKISYQNALSFATPAQKSILDQLIANDDERLRIANQPLQTPTQQRKPVLPVVLKIAPAVVAVGAGALALMLRSTFRQKLDNLNAVSKRVDPEGSGEIAIPTDYSTYEAAYQELVAAQQKQGLYKACLGVAAAATLAEAYFLIHKPKPRRSAVQWQPARQGWGLALQYHF